ncbi:hypothetical protein CTEN210_09090 [Chaetoceros tenuissimus]|uniref:Guanylyl cyclase n=1 Tax=Chaetoceros tenuissimus TaxID=426638 RepID=A0AAD3CVG5_9STRA|nr:hypothetical protein CTEN210_09090 [Chaetoceros tenuissimus]
MHTDDHTTNHDMPSSASRKRRRKGPVPTLVTKEDQQETLSSWWAAVRAVMSFSDSFRSLFFKTFAGTRETTLSNEEIEKIQRQEFDEKKATFLQDDRENIISQENEISEINHVKQLETWDCGIACVQMILRWLSHDTINKPCDESRNVPLSHIEIQQRHQFLKEIGTDSIWSIDLVMLLHKILQRELDLYKDANHYMQLSNASILFSSKKLGVDGDYKRFQYYQQTFRKDRTRVKALFQSAKDRYISMCEMNKLSLHKVAELVKRNDTIAMILIDNNVLRREEEEKELDCYTGEYVHSPSLLSFSGHYIIICGISTDSEKIAIAKRSKDAGVCPEEFCFVVRNPGDTSLDYISLSLLETAWRSSGTDDDIIFIRKYV